MVKGPVPIIYGKMKVAGNMIYSRLSGDKKVIYKIIGLADGPIQKISELKLDDTDANSSKFEGVSYNFYLGNGTQTIDSRVEGGSQEVQAQKVGGLKNLAYIALQAKAKALVFYHYDPSYDDARLGRIEEYYTSNNSNVYMSYEGMEINLL